MEIPKEGNIVLKFGAEWCGPCKAFKPILEELKKENESVEFIDVNVDEHKELAREYGVRSIPIVFFIRDGEIQSNLVGMKTKDAIQENINLLME